MAESELLPCVVFGFNRPAKLKRILAALRPQAVERLVVFIDGPRGPQDQSGVEECRQAARGVDWAETELFFWEDNHGLARLTENIDRVLERYPWAVIVEDDCLPMPGFYAFMRQALQRYRDQPQVFSVGGYQPLRAQAFAGSPAAVVGSARFLCWGWGTWRDRWQAAAADIAAYKHLFDDLRSVPDIAGDDLPEIGRGMAGGQLPEIWDMKVALACLHRRQIQVLPVHGLVRNIGLDRTGIHGSLAGALRDLYFQNRNLAERLPDGLAWPETPALDCEYAAALRQFISRNRRSSARRLWQRGEVLLRRYIWPRHERLLFSEGQGWQGAAPLAAFNRPEDLGPAAGDGPRKHALLAYITYPFFIPRDDPRFMNHINIFHTQQMARSLNRMGYLVDVVDYRDRGFKPDRAYDLFIGHAAVNFEQIAGQLPPGARKIYLSTGSYWQYHNDQEAQRFAAFAARRGASLPPDRRIAASEEPPLRLADGILGIGNQHTRSTYAGFQNVAMINGTTLVDAQFDWCPKDYQAGRRHFLFFASGGNVHKGLDLVLEAFFGSELDLWVIAPLDPQFLEVYRAELAANANIHLLGRIQPRSAAFYQAVRLCNFSLLPSCSEGQAQSVIECMNQGLIPLVSPQAGVDVDGFGRLLPEPTVAGLRAAIDELAGLPAETCQELGRRARQAAQNIYSEAQFGEYFQAALAGLLANARQE